MRAATVMGKTQYPITQTDWKKLMVPPSNCAFIVTIADPAQTRTKTEANTKAAWFVGARKERMIERTKQTIKGPLKRMGR